MGLRSRAHIPAIMGPLRHGSYFDQWKIIAGRAPPRAGNPALGQALHPIEHQPPRRRRRARPKIWPDPAANSGSFVPTTTSSAVLREIIAALRGMTAGPAGSK